MKYIIISGFNISDNNRGTAALGYGSLSFLKEIGELDKEHELLTIIPVFKCWQAKYKNRVEQISIHGNIYMHHIIYVPVLVKWLLDKFGLLFPFTQFKHYLKKTDFVAAINGGDGFSDIYGTSTFLSRLHDINYAIKLNIPLFILPQTLGPFQDKSNYLIARRILRYAKKIYVRDDKFVNELKTMEVNFEQSEDLSAYMLPEPWEIDIKQNSIGINVSGLAYSNQFRTLSGQFEQYPYLIDATIRHFQSLGKNVYLIPHSYNYTNPELNNDDMLACREAYNRLEDKTNVVLIDKDLISPQIKYVISRMSFFIGTRMHANFAAIYTGVPLFGMAYSYKFEGAFNANGLDGAFQTAMINNLTKEEIPTYLEKIDKVYNTIKKA